jgi:hypothetical protein
MQNSSIQRNQGSLLSHWDVSSKFGAWSEQTPFLSATGDIEFYIRQPIKTLSSKITISRMNGSPTIALGGIDVYDNKGKPLQELRITAISKDGFNRSIVNETIRIDGTPLPGRGIMSHLLDLDNYMSWVETNSDIALTLPGPTIVSYIRVWDKQFDVNRNDARLSLGDLDDEPKLITSSQEVFSFRCGNSSVDYLYGNKLRFVYGDVGEPRPDVQIKGVVYLHNTWTLDPKSSDIQVPFGPVKWTDTMGMFRIDRDVDLKGTFAVRGVQISSDQSNLKSCQIQILNGATVVWKSDWIKPQSDNTVNYIYSFTLPIVVR